MGSFPAASFMLKMSCPIKMELGAILISRVTRVFTNVSIFYFEYNNTLCELPDTKIEDASDPEMVMK